MKLKAFWFGGGIVLITFAFLVFALFECRSELRAASQDGLKVRLLEALVDFEKGFLDWSLNARKMVLETVKKPMVQKLSRPKVRKAFASKRRSDWLNQSMRITVYTVRQSRGEIKLRPVFEDHRPRLIWDKVLEMLARNSLETTGELDSDSKQGAGKMKELASLVLKGTGLSSLQKPTSFTTLDFLGEQTQFYWDVLYRRCPQKIRVEKGLERCVKGLFLAELSPRLLLRDFWQQQDQSESGLSYALIYSSGTGEGRAVESLFPWTLQDSFATAQALRNLGSRGVPQVYKDRDSLCMLTALKGVRQAHLTACLKEGI